MEDGIKGHVCVTYFHGKSVDFLQKTKFPCVWCSKNLWNCFSTTSAFSTRGSEFHFPWGGLRTSISAEKRHPISNLVSYPSRYPVIISHLRLRLHCPSPSPLSHISSPYPSLIAQLSSPSPSLSPIKHFPTKATPPSGPSLFH
eukprot:TRINITY_DN21661_c1_g1_i3.p1 TRINITY_DN21661_c1_g1~~TRINITY_DN21661_c1_g1_i3.p1  ORF type:complete len:143 (+),score=15.55 TRINITY_DN21661_c1_g1_i3:248-676(+)